MGAFSPLSRLCIVCMAGAVLPALAAAEAQRVTEGRRIAEASCLTCHAETGSSSKAPSFAAIGAMPSATELSIKVFLQTSHATMPNIMLDERQRDALAAYILDRGGK